MLQSINTFKNSIKYSEHETEDLFNSFKEFLRLPVWKHRYEVYSIWVFTRIIDGLTEADIKFNIRDNTLSFPFSGACLAEVSLGGKQYEVWTELRTAAIVHPTGRSRKKHIQPDYSIVCGDANSVSNSVLVIECKQYKKSNTSNFGHAIIDYAYNRPMAKVLLANYGVINEQSMSNALQNLPDERYGLFSFCRPNSDTARALSAEVRRILYRKSRLYKVNTSKNVIFTLFWDENQNCDHQDLDLHLLYTDTLTGVSSTLSYKEQNIDGAQYSGDVRCSPGTEQIIIQHFMPGYIQSNDSQYDREALRGFIAFLNQKYKPRTVKRKIASVKGYLSFLQDEEVISDNPFIGMRISLPKSLSIPRTIPLRTINAMLVEAHNFEGHAVTSFSHFCALRNTAVIELLFATGMRISELCGIAEKDLDLSEGLVFIHGKGNRERIVEIANCEVLAALKRYDQAKPKHIKAFFLNNRGNPLTDQSARRIIEKCAKKVDPFRHITPHMFRHSFATMLLEEDVDIRYIQQMLGHSSISTTQIYAHVSSEKRRAILSTKHPRNKMTIE